MLPLLQKLVDRLMPGAVCLLAALSRDFSRANPAFLKRLAWKWPRTVKRSSEPYLVQQGWKLTDPWAYPREWQGYYRTRYGSFKGRLEQSTPSKFYIRHPPKPLRKHHWECFTQLEDGWYSIHFSTLPPDPNDGVIAIERLIHEAFRLYQTTA